MSEVKGDRWMITAWKASTMTELKKHLFKIAFAGREYCPSTLKCHYQLYVECKKDYSLGSIKRIINDKEAHYEIARNTQDICIRYCAKDNDIVLDWDENHPNAILDRHPYDPVEPYDEEIFDVFGIKCNCPC